MTERSSSEVTRQGQLEGYSTSNRTCNGSATALPEEDEINDASIAPCLLHRVIIYLDKPVVKYFINDVLDILEF